MNYYLGIDLGTSSVKALLMDAEGVVTGTSQQSYGILKSQVQYAEQDMEHLWEATKKTVAELVGKYPGQSAKIQGIGFSGQMHGLVMVDTEGKVIRNAIIWADQRSSQMIEQIYDVVGEENFREVTLNSLSTGFLITSLMWVKEYEEEHYERTYRVMFPKDYIRYRMCGEFGTDMSDASSGAIFDTKKRRWSWELIDQLKLRRELFPSCHEAGDIAGILTGQCARELGLNSGIRITYGGGDTLMMGVGNGIVMPGLLASNIGTACQLSGSFPAPIYDKQFRTNTFCHVKKDLWLLMGAHLSGGVALKWLMEQILNMSSYDQMTKLAADVLQGSEGLVFLPYLSGERTPYNDPKARGIYFGLTLKHERGHLIRSTMEGIVFGLRSSLEIFKSLGVEYHKIVAAGGGARSRLFLEMQADIFDCEIYTNQGNEQACIGAAITAATACGEYRNMAEACGKVVQLSDTVVAPNQENQRYYEEQFVIFQELYGHNRDLFHLKG